MILGSSGSMVSNIDYTPKMHPGNLKVSRGFGHAQAKLEAYGGNANVLIAEPDQ